MSSNPWDERKEGGSRKRCAMNEKEEAGAKGKKGECKGNDSESIWTA